MQGWKGSAKAGTGNWNRKIRKRLLWVRQNVLEGVDMSKALIIGAAGFVGGYLIKELQEAWGMETAATKLPNEELSVPGTEVYDLNILNKDDISALLNGVKPDYIFHLAAQSSVAVAWRNPGLTVDVNVKGAIHVLDAVRELDYAPRILLIGSGEEYGHLLPGEVPVREGNVLRPGNLYAATKACQNMVGSIYAQAYQMKVMMVRAFNHIGPAQLPIFVIADFCKQVAEIEAGLKEPVIKVGNLDARRDFTDVRDVVKAYAGLAQKGTAGETYNVGSGKSRRIGDILKLIISMASVPISVEVDPARLRPIDVPVIEADITKLHEITGWQPRIPFETTVRETLDYWRVEALMQPGNNCQIK